MTRDEIVLRGLDARLKSIDFFGENLEKTSENERDYSRFYREIGFFIHYIVKTKELTQILLELVEYGNKLKDNSYYNSAKENFLEHTRIISTELLNHPDFNNYKAACLMDYKNPLLNPLTLRIEPLLKSFLNLDLQQNSGLTGIVENILQVVLAIYRDWSFNQPNGYEKIAMELNKLSDSVNEIKFLEGFEHDYFGVRSALNLFSIYISLNPRTNLGATTNLYVINELIQSGKAIHIKGTIEELRNDCRKIYHYLIEKLTSQLSIEITIDRFIVYMSLYFNGKIKGNTPEKDLQNKFEEFVFQSGYYPISEAQVKDGRIDTLIINDTNSFLFEFKQVDFGKNKGNISDIKNKLKWAQVQSSIYIDRLKALQNIQKSVFVILFTNRKIFYKKGIDRVEKDGVRFIFKCVYVYVGKPSEVKNDVEIDLEEIIN